MALSSQGKVYFWGQYCYPLKEGEPTRYGRILQPKLHVSLSREFIVDIKAGSSHSLALNDQGALYSWGEGLQGQLGISLKQNSIDAQRVTLDKGVYLSKISAGVAHSAAITVFG